MVGAPRGRAAVGTGQVARAEVLRAGRPGLLDIVADVDGRLAHLVVGLRGVADEQHFLRAGEEAALGLLDDDARDSPCAPTRCATPNWDRCCSPPSAAWSHGPGPVAVVRDDADATVLDCGDRGDLLVFPWLADAPRPDVDFMMGIEEAGFNHVAAPLVRWVWEGRDLGVVQEPLADRSGGWALALTSLRDFYASGGTPEAAGGDFGSEARALGVMTARLHLALDRAFLRHHEQVVDWVDEAEAAIAAADATLLEAPGVPDLVKWLREADIRLPVLRTHGDLQLGRTARTDQGWVVCDSRPGGVLAGETVPRRRTPLADVADMLWSFHRASITAAAERDPAGRLGLESLGQAWEARNRRAFVPVTNARASAGWSGPDRRLGPGAAVGILTFLELGPTVTGCAYQRAPCRSTAGG